MELLYLLESTRNPVLDTFFSLVTYFGDETLFIVCGLLFFWCINKYEGYYLLSVGLAGKVINQFLKLIFCVPRPWVKDPEFTIVESAREAATGYSFPSGHTQTSVGVFGSVARCHKEKFIRGAAIAICVLVPLSRMYLGVHTPADVGVSVAVALALIFGFYPVVKKAMEKRWALHALFGAMTALALAYLAFVNFYPFSAGVDAANLSRGTKNAYTLLGCILAVWLTYVVEERYIRFDTKAVWWVQILKLALGLGILLGIKAGLKAPLSALLNGSYLADGIRYFAMTAFAGCVWPLTFPLFAKLEKKK